LTGEPLSGKQAVEIELINQAVPFGALEATVRALAERLARLPLSQLAAMKLIVNQAYENMGLAATQLLGPVLDGYMRNTPEALRFVEVAASEGVATAVAERDGPFRDYSQAPAERQPDPRNVIRPK
jgi:enoyl-CoA hydratase